MILQVLYLLVLCEMGPAPCPGPFFRDGDKPQHFTRPREKCLATARAVEDKFPKHKVYCVGSDGASLDAAGRVINEQEFFDGLERWRGAQKR